MDKAGLRFQIYFQRHSAFPNASNVLFRDQFLAMNCQRCLAQSTLGCSLSQQDLLACLTPSSILSNFSMVPSFQLSLNCFDRGIAAFIGLYGTTYEFSPSNVNGNSDS